MSAKNSKIVMITMFKNESRVIRRMLDSVRPYVDYYVMQNNGSTDGTDEIAKQFLEENGLSGEIYFCEEGWKGFGWNRDHLIQYCQNQSQHGCDWILKMDCDEILEVDDDFDWSPLDNKETQAFHIPIVAGTCVYQRAWMYNANLPWRFNHDPCHETVYCDLPGIGTEFQRVDLDRKFRHVGFNEGQSWSDPFKFISHALVLEEQMIKDGTMLTNHYHFWYIGKSYFDAYKSTAFPLGESQQKEYARRCTYYFTEYVNVTHDFKNTRHAKHIDEMAYMGMVFGGEAYRFLGEYESAANMYKAAHTFAPGRNDHYFALALMYQYLEDWDNMLYFTSIMMQPERTCPYPQYSSFIDFAMYHDGGTQIQELHNIAFQNVQRKKQQSISPVNFIINKSKTDRMFIVDNFYSNPDEVRNFALTQVEYHSDLRWFKGQRSTTTYVAPGTKEAFERIMGKRITKFDYGWTGCFQLCVASDPQVYHYDQQKWAAMIYLTPDAPYESGTRLHGSKINKARHITDPEVDAAFNGNFYDSTKFDIVDNAGNVYNRLVIMDAGCIHSAGPYFGDTLQNGRLTHLFFFD
jgi:glycosyltransferase involved in cell wall biosynthesis